MDFDFSPEQQEFAREVERFLDENDDPEIFDLTRENMAQIVDTPKRRELMGKIGARGWLGITWPTEWGGQGLTPAHNAGWIEECARVGVPPFINMVGIVLAGQAILRFGTPEQQARHHSS